MKLLKKPLKYLLYLLLLPVAYGLVALLLTYITVDRVAEGAITDKSIYLSTNGVHLDVIIPMDAIDENLLEGLRHADLDAFLAFGWGDENFYINTPTWDDLTFGNAFEALFLDSTTLMHVTRYESKRSSWVEVKLSTEELAAMNAFIENTFQKDGAGAKLRLDVAGYSTRDDFYKAEGNYHIFNTCNSWVNMGFKSSGLKACVWTPFDFGLLGEYEP